MGRFFKKSHNIPNSYLWSYKIPPDARYRKYLELRENYYELHGLQSPSAISNSYYGEYYARWQKTEMNVAWLRYLRENISKSDARYDWIFAPSHGINLIPSATSVLVDAPNGLFATGVCASATLVRRERLIAESRTKNIHHNALCKTSVTNIPAFSFTFSVVTRKKY